MTSVQSIIDLILKEIPGAPFGDTVDTVKTGDAGQTVTGIVITFLASVDVLRRAAAQGANFIITHEPTFYNHRDETGWLRDDPVFQAKRRLIEEHGLVIWRFHDYWHSHQPDGILTGMLRLLGWESRVDPVSPVLVNLPEQSVQELVDDLKARLPVGTVRVVGPLDLICRRAVLLPGALDGQQQISAFALNPDVLICGEINEWETSEYVRDAAALGLNRALIVLGHAASEEGGMQYLSEWLKPRVPGVPVTHIPTGDAFQFV